MRTLFIVLGFAAATSVQAADAKAGQAVYDKSCKSCHAPDGAGNAAVAKMMKVDMKDLKSPEVQAMSDDDLTAAREFISRTDTVSIAPVSSPCHCGTAKRSRRSASESAPPRPMQQAPSQISVTSGFQ